MTPDEIAAHIPDEVEEAAALRLKQLFPISIEHGRIAARAALAAGLAAWPQKEVHTDGTEDWIELTLPSLPLSTEHSDG